MEPTWLVVGLGNPGTEYTATRHNIGYMVLDESARRWTASHKQKKYRSRIAESRSFAAHLVFLWPRTYMNRSGVAVAKAMADLDLSPSQLLIIHDDIDLELGRLKVKQGGGTAGHQGLVSIQQWLQDSGFVRVRVGIGRPDDGQEVTEFVLSPFEQEEIQEIETSIQKAADAVDMIVRKGPVAAMNEFNRSEPLSPEV